MKRFIPTTAIAILLPLLSHTALADDPGFVNSAASVGPADYVTPEPQLLETLRTGSVEQKAIACKQLAIHGTAKSCPELGMWLADPKLASWARTALEAITDPAADAELRAAAAKLDGKLLVGVINTIGVRRDAGAVDLLANQLKKDDPEAASAAAVALGRIADEKSVATLRQSLASSPDKVRNAVAEGCILCAERLLARGIADKAIAIYDEVRQAKVPQQRILEATRGAILARGDAGYDLLVEQLNSPDRKHFYLGLQTLREYPVQIEASTAAELLRQKTDRAALILRALADRHDFVITPEVLAAAASDDKQLKLTAIEVVGKSGDAASVATLMKAAADDDEQISEAARNALASLPAQDVNAEIGAQLPNAKGKALPIILGIIGQRRIESTPALVKSLRSDDRAVRRAALAALGETIRQSDLPVLIEEALKAEGEEESSAALTALHAAAVRMPDREDAAGLVSAAFATAPSEVKVKLLATLGSMGGPRSLAAIAEAIKTGDDPLKDAGSRLLGEWMTADAAPVLLDLAKSNIPDKYKVRALRGYIRIARQFKVPDADRIVMAREALAAAGRLEEQQLALTILERYPSLESLEVAATAASNPELKNDAARAAMLIAQKIPGESTEETALIEKIGIKPVKIEIVNAQYGSADAKKDVTADLQKQTGKYPVITLPASTYNKSFGGDPAPDATKELQVEYRINGKPGSAKFAENAIIYLPAN